jgi:hypothetical protein
LLLAALTFALAGCAAPLDPTSHITSPGDQGVAQGGVTPVFEPIPRSNLYPLQVGNRWLYERTERTQIIPNVGDPLPPDVQTTDFEVTLPCQVTFDGLDYIVQLESFPEFNSHYFYLYRQTSEELSGRDIGGGEVPCAAPAMGLSSAPTKPRSEAILTRIKNPAQRAAYAAAIGKVRERMEATRRPTVGLGDREFTFLSYPLYTGKSWQAKVEGNFVRTVEGQDLLNVPAGTFAALRLGIDSEFLGPMDTAHIWYGPRGVIRFHASFQGIATDDEGNPIGIVVSTSTEELKEISLVGGP